jgi:exopolysaccharide biosynthesis protein
MPLDVADGVSEVVGGFPLLLQGGMRAGDLQVAALPSFAAARHPRTAVGFDAFRKLLWIVVVDGRQEGHSEGMTLPELTRLFEGLAVTDAINLDGGGSAVMVLDGVKVSHPSDADGERPVVNALGVMRDRAFCRR